MITEVLNSKITAYSAYDPTRTTALRNAFSREMKRRFDELIRVIIEAIVQQDCFGLQKLRLFQMAAPYYQKFNFSRSQDKINAFMQWLAEQEALGIFQLGELQQIGLGIEGVWTNKYIFDSYKRGVLRSRYEMQKAGYKVPSIDMTGGIDITMANPVHLDRLGVLFTRTFNDLKGITSTMDTQISRVLAQGIADGDNPILLARKMRGVIAGAGTGELGITDTLGRFIPAKRRAEMIARTEVIRAHHQATIQEYENWAMEGVIVKAEFKTAGGTACDQCKSLEGKIFSLQEIRNLIPVHPNCFLDPNTPVYTEGGYKRIANIKKGELVLTHKKRFRPVTAAIKTNVDECEVVSIKFKNTYLTMTADHPVMKNSEWIPVGDCFEGDLVTTMEYYFEDYELISWPIEVMKKYFMETPQTLYNLSVDEDESFVAKGLVVHNCRCVALPKIVE